MCRHAHCAQIMCDSNRKVSSAANSRTLPWRRAHPPPRRHPRRPRPPPPRAAAACAAAPASCCPPPRLHRHQGRTHDNIPRTVLHAGDLTAHVMVATHNTAPAGVAPCNASIQASSTSSGLYSTYVPSSSKYLHAATHKFRKFVAWYSRARECPLGQV